MATITFRHRGSFKKTEAFFDKVSTGDYIRLLRIYGRKGIELLAAATPNESGTTAESWGYEIETGNGFAVLRFTNSNVNDGCNIAIILQYGHGTGTGGWVEGRDYINPAIRPLFDQLANEAWREVLGK